MKVWPVNNFWFHQGQITQESEWPELPFLLYAHPQDIVNKYTRLEENMLKKHEDIAPTQNDMGQKVRWTDGQGNFILHYAQPPTIQ